jgi:adenine/guanine phosphoribosyltransferase-like PRPP-binding protein
MDAQAVPEANGQEVVFNTYPLLGGGPMLSKDVDTMVSLKRNDPEEYADFVNPMVNFLMGPPPDATQRVRIRADKPRLMDLSDLRVNYPDPITSDPLRYTYGDPKVLQPFEKGFIGPLPKPEVRYRADYLKDFLNPSSMRDKIAQAVKALEPQAHLFDSIAFTGMSGTLIGPPVAMALSKEVIMVRKPDQSTHSSMTVEGNYGSRSYIILDDMRASGATEHRIVRAISSDIPSAVYMGFLGVLGMDWETFREFYRSGENMDKLPYPLRPKVNYS